MNDYFYYDRYYYLDGHLVWTPMPQEWRIMYIDNQNPGGHDPGDEDRD